MKIGKNPAVQPEDTPYYFVVEKTIYPNSTLLQIHIKDENGERSPFKYRMPSGRLKDPYGYIKAVSPINVKEFYYISASNVTSAYNHGPLLYDLLMEIVTIADSYLTSDTSVSQDAANIWEYYFNKRKDVRKERISKIYPESDISYKFSDIQRNYEWYKELKREGENPLLYAYTKFPRTLLALEKMNRIELKEKQP